MMVAVRFGAPAEFAILGNSLFFSMFHLDYGYEVFWLDLTGSIQGAQLLKDIYPGKGEYDLPNGSDPWHLTVVEGDSAGTYDRLYFRAKDPVAGTELWVSDGSSSGTVLLKDFSPGSEDSDLDEFHVIGHKLFFREDVKNLWTVDLTREENEEPDGGDSVKPKVSIKNPKRNSRVRGRFTVRGVVEDNYGVSSIQCRHAGVTDWTEVVETSREAIEAGGEKVAWKCPVRLKKAVQRKLRAKKRGKVAVRIRAEDYAGNSATGRRVLYLR